MLQNKTLIKATVQVLVEITLDQFMNVDIGWTQGSTSAVRVKEEAEMV
jgi:hypothetical protein